MLGDVCEGLVASLMDWTDSAVNTSSHTIFKWCIGRQVLRHMCEALVALLMKPTDFAANASPHDLEFGVLSGRY